jgi:hypothetical protein
VTTTLSCSRIWQDELLGGEKARTATSEHDKQEADPVLLAKVPLGHGVQEEMLADSAENEPNGQSPEGADKEAPTQCFPEGHGRGDNEPRSGQ